ncbi:MULTISPECIES: TetR/AcrR family transcriptional regulator [unclassified Haematobacter]|uniref:TetR/AcrR family transcriptional regulator n=1 Tax=unclassified Haematobacter TaxID=2640585 RepID=UPI0025C3C93E|nr:MULTISPECIES: TetR/AcrR family transcriptional regulator [unclassified Haematobacter]
MARTTGSRSDITRQRLQDAALRLFAAEGYAAVSMRRIAAEVGVQAGALYLYTPDKQTLLFDLMHTHMQDILSAWEGEAPFGSDPRARLDAFVAFHLRFNLDRPEAVFVSYMELRSLEPANFALIEGLRRRYEDALEAILSEGVRAGVFRIADTRVTTLALIAMLTGVNTWYRSGGRLSREGVTRLYTGLAHGTVGAMNAPNS